LQRFAYLIGGGERTKLGVPLTAIHAAFASAQRKPRQGGERCGFESYEPPQKLVRNTQSWTLWVIVASTFLLLVGYQYWAVPETYVVQYGRAVVLRSATLAAFKQLIALLIPVVLVLVAGLTLDRMAPPIPD
jgi:hypothetical protein